MNNEVELPYSSHTALFLMNYITDHKGRTCSDIINLTDFWLEKEHMFFCHIFPIDSGTIGGYEMRTDEVMIHEFKNDNALKVKHRVVLDRMMKLYGLIRLDKSLAPIDRNTISSMVWLRKDDHKHHVRIMRLLRSLYVLGQPELAKGLCSEMIRIARSYGDVKETTIELWISSVSFNNLSHVLSFSNRDIIC